MAGDIPKMTRLMKPVAMLQFDAYPAYPAYPAYRSHRSRRRGTKKPVRRPGRHFLSSNAVYCMGRTALRTPNRRKKHAHLYR